ncbi:hypothetical protein C0J52_17011 [Blattella germanica]|nr:hypothetical protein C0J52_17011 [Blattella germanica]
MTNKESLIVFVYDTQKCKREEDDPKDAVMYFSPDWATEQEKFALVGQLMGSRQFFVSTFSSPRIISLNTGKFVLREFGRYVLTIGTINNIPDWVIEHRANTLNRIIQFYHKDLETVAAIVGSDPAAFSAKLKEMFETYLEVISYAANLFGNIHSIKLPKCHAETVTMSFHPPIGVRLLQVYMESKEYFQLQRNSAAARISFENVANRKLAQKKVLSGKTQTPKDPVTAMKRDISRIFTVPEEKEGETEQAEEDSSSPHENGADHMPSSTFNIMKEFDTSSFISSNLPTPMREINVNKILHAKVMSICSKNKDSDVDASKEVSAKRGLFSKAKEGVSLYSCPPEKPKRRKPKSTNFLVNYCESDVRSSSLNDLQQNPRNVSNRVPMRYYSFGLPRVTSDMTDDNSDYSPVRNIPMGKHFYNTISDPLHPVFRCDGLPISRSLYNENLARHYQLLDLERSDESSPGDISKLSFTNLLTSVDEIMDLQENEINDQNGEVPIVEKPVEVQPEISLTEEKEEPEAEKEEEKQPELVYRRSLSLPLKTMTSDYEDEEMRRRSTSYTAGVLESPAVRTKTLGGLQLTPLMSKLSLLAMEEKTSGFCSRDTTPGEFKDLSFPGSTYASSVAEQTRKKIDAEKRDVEMEQEENGDSTDNLISSWEKSISSLGNLETNILRCSEHFPQTEGTEPYNYLCVDPNWDMVEQAGQWASSDLEVVASMHSDFVKQPNLSEVTVRCEDSTVFGYQCAENQIFYQQSAGNTVGLPTPSDLMALVSLKARRRLERDHSVLLL